MIASQPPIDPYLEENYNLRARRSDVDSVLQDWSARSETYRLKADASLDCAYGDGDREQLDIFRSGEANAPLYVYIHGGYWQRGDKAMYSFVAEGFNSIGVDVAIVGYPLCPQVSMSGLVTRIRDALGWIYRNAVELGINADRINLSGHSAGGQLAALGVCTDWSGFADDLPVDLLKAAIPLSGLYQLEPLRFTTINEALKLTDTEVLQLSPQTLRPVGEAPVLVVLGGAETAEFFRQTDELLDSWSDLTPRIEKFVEPGVDHFDLVNRLASRDSRVFQKISAWLK